MAVSNHIYPKPYTLNNMLMFKLKRIGKKHQASFRLVVDEKRHKLYGENTEDLGWYDPQTKKSQFNLERVNYWLKNGAQPSDTVHNLFVNSGILKAKKIAVHKKPKKAAEAEGAKPAAPVAQAAAPAEQKPAA